MRRLLLLCLLAVPCIASAQSPITRHFDVPIDALSVQFQSDDPKLDVSGLVAGEWTPWESLLIENEQDPTLRESNLVMFPSAVSDIRFRGDTTNFTVHPIRVSPSPTSYKVASNGTNGGAPHILSRSEWGADESLTVDHSTAGSPSNDDDSTAIIRSDESSARIQNCQNANSQYPDEFRTVRTVTTLPNGDHLRWPQQYSPNVNLLVIHHTAILNTGDTRSGAEKMHALYAYHANNRNWGDIGYNYVIDANGQIFEGRGGGDYVVGGHAYCNNIGSMGIALMGNFDEETPSQSQTQSLQWLLQTLAQKYHINLNTNVVFHGKTLPPIVGHRQLLSTDCPGFEIFQTLEQIRNHVRSGDVLATVLFPPLPSPGIPSDSTKPYVDHTTERRDKRLTETSQPQQVEGLFAVGGTALSGRPGEETAISVRYQTGPQQKAQRASIGAIALSDPRILLWEDQGGTFQKISSQLFMPQFLRANASLTFRLKIQFPRQGGSYTLKIGPLSYTLDVSGKRVPLSVSSPILPTVPRSSSSSSRAASSSSSASSIIRLPWTPSPARSSSSSSSSSARPPGSAYSIRIRLSYGSDGLSPADSASLTLPSGTLINGNASDGNSLQFAMSGDQCIALQNGIEKARGIVRIDGGTNIITIDSWRRDRDQFRGVVECQVVDGALTLINELPLETYMHGLAEEPDSQPYEKQRAFAIAARTYALYYMDPSHRKFPGKPYDGSDNPAQFQIYGGALFEAKNPRWIQAVDSTAQQVMTINNAVIRAPYFSSDDGRTRSPDELGGSWANFPFKDIFTSKPDPWCTGMTLNGHGVGMSGCGAGAQAREGKKAEQILQYYYPGTVIKTK